MHIILQNCLSLSLAFAGLSVHSRKPTVFWFFWVSALVHTLCLRKMAKEMRKQLPFDRDAIMMFYHYYNPSTWHNTASAPGTQVQVRVVPKSTHHLHMPGTRVPVSGTSTSAAPGTLVLAPLPVLRQYHGILQGSIGPLVEYSTKILRKILPPVLLGRIFAFLYTIFSPRSSKGGVPDSIDLSRVEHYRSPTEKYYFGRISSIMSKYHVPSFPVQKKCNLGWILPVTVLHWLC